MTYLSRALQSKLPSLLEQRKVLVLLGPRQVGKTTLLQHELAHTPHLMLNLDFELDRTRLQELATLDIPQIVNRLGGNQVLVIDEAQNMPEIGSIVKGWYDKFLPIKIILLGSSTLDILGQTTEPLTGRNTKEYLTPFMFSEIISHQAWFTPQSDLQTQLTSLHHFLPTLKSMMLERVVYGSYPETVTTLDKENYLQQLAGDYLLKDVLYTGQIKNPHDLQRLLLLLAHQVGNEVSINELSNTLDQPRYLIEKSLDLLEQTFVIFRLPAMSSNPRNEVMGTKKIYFWDTGIRNALLKEFSLSPNRSDIGKLWENWIIAEFMKWNLASGNLHTLAFWRSRGGSEVDLIIRHNEMIEAYEIKWSRPRRAMGQGFTEVYQTPIHLINPDHLIPTLLEKQFSRRSETFLALSM